MVNNVNKVDIVNEVDDVEPAAINLMNSIN